MKLYLKIKYFYFKISFIFILFFSLSCGGGVFPLYDQIPIIGSLKPNNTSTKRKVHHPITPIIFTQTVEPDNSPLPLGFIPSFDYSFHPELPKGLKFDASTLKITGVPTEASSQNYTITATGIINVAGTFSTNFSIEITPIEISGSLTTDTTSTMINVYHTITPIKLDQTIDIISTPDHDVTPTRRYEMPTLHYTIKPELPKGLKFDARTLQITGTPTETVASTDYTITATGITDTSGTFTSNPFSIAVYPIPIKGNLKPIPTFTSAIHDQNIAKISFNLQVSSDATNLTLIDDAVGFDFTTDPQLPQDLTLRFDNKGRTGSTFEIDGTPTKIYPKNHFKIIADGTPNISGRIISEPFSIEVRPSLGKVCLGKTFIDFTQYFSWKTKVSTTDGTYRVNCIYVTPTGNGMKNGKNWTDATSIDALKNIAPASNTNIYLYLLKAGTYVTTTNDSFSLKDHVGILGGFEGQYQGQEAEYRAGETKLIGNGSHVILNENISHALLEGVTISNGSSSDGGGMYNFNSSPTLINVIFSSNSASNNGGAIYNMSSDSMLINAVFDSNSASNNGGAMYNSSSSSNLMLINSIFSSNSASGDGGAMYNNSPHLMLTNAILHSNNASRGGAIYNDSGNIQLINATWSSNDASHGRAIYNNKTIYTIIHNTFYDTIDSSTATVQNVNKAESIIINSLFFHQFTKHIINNDSSARIRSSLFSGCSADQTANDCLGENSNASWNYDGSSFTSHDIGVLQNNGGFIETIFIPSSSDAKDTGRPAGFSGEQTCIYDATGFTLVSYRGGACVNVRVVTTDARGFPRDSSPDLGAYEFQPP